MKGHHYNTECPKCKRLHIPPRSGKILSELTKAKISLARARTISSDSTKALLSSISREHWKDPSYVKKVSEGLKSAWANPKTRRHWITGQAQVKQNLGRFTAGATPWNKGLTKDIDARVARYSARLKGKRVANPNVFNEWRAREGIINTYPKLRYVPALGHPVRSHWEEDFALELVKRGVNYEYEKITFKLQVDGKTTRYTPDFHLLASNVYFEVKGYLRPSATRRFWSLKEQYPSISLTIVGMDKEEDLAKMLPFPQFKFEDRGKAISSVIPSIEVHAT